MRASATVREIAAQCGATPAQVALAWLLNKDSNLVPIPGTKRRAFLEENVQSVDLQLTSGEMDQLDNALPPEKVSGPRYNERMMGYIDR